MPTGTLPSRECFQLRSDHLQELLAAHLPEDAAAAQEDVAEEAATVRSDPPRERVGLRLLESAVALVTSTTSLPVRSACST